MEPNQSNRARALLSIIEPKVGKSARRHVSGYRRISEQVGAHLAAWAYADNRLPTSAASILGAWTGQPVVLTIQGDVGSGKTVTAARVVAERGGLLLRAGEVDRWDYVGTGVKRAKAAPCLLVDDLGMERAGGRGEEHLIEILCARSDNGQEAIITTMLSRGQVAERYPEQLLSRMSPGWRISNGPDLRAKGLTPSSTAIERARTVVKCVDALERISRGVVWGDTAEETLTSAVQIAGLTPEQLEVVIAEQVVVDERNTKNMETMANEFFAGIELRATKSASARRDKQAKATATLAAITESE